MEKHYAKVAPHVLDLPEPEQDLQEALFSLDEDTLLKLDRNEATVSAYLSSEDGIPRRRAAGPRSVASSRMAPIWLKLQPGGLAGAGVAPQTGALHRIEFR